MKFCRINRQAPELERLADMTGVHEARGGAISCCLVAGEYPPAIGGLADYAAILARHLAAQGVRVTVVTGGGPNPSPHLPLPEREADGPSDPGGLRRISRWGFQSGREIARTAVEVQAQVVHLQYQTAAYGLSPAINLLPILLRACGVRARFVTTFHDLRGPYLFPKASRLRDLVVHALVGSSDASIFTDPADLARAHPRRAAAWIPIGSNLTPLTAIDRVAERARLGIGSRELAVAYFGFMNTSKGVDVLLRAAHRLVRARVELRLLLVGDELGASDPTNRATAQRLRALAANLGLEERIIRTGPMPADGLSRALGAADLAALPFVDGASLRRGSLLACLAHGLPVVTTRPTITPDVAPPHRVAPFDETHLYRVDERVAALVPRRDDAALAREIYRLAHDPGRREELGQAARSLAGRLQWPSIAEATAAVYRRALGGD